MRTHEREKKYDKFNGWRMDDRWQCMKRIPRSVKTSRGLSFHEILFWKLCSWKFIETRKETFQQKNNMKWQFNILLTSTKRTSVRGIKQYVWILKKNWTGERRTARRVPLCQCCVQLCNYSPCINQNVVRDISGELSEFGVLILTEEKCPREYIYIEF